LHHGEENVHIQGQDVSGEQNRCNLKIYLVMQHH
jgi:hypothetical protein